MKERMQAFWGLIFVVILIVPYILGVWDDYGYIYVFVAAIALLLVTILGRHVTPTFWWQGLRKKNNKDANKDKGS
jgi:Flp pilus assembly protein TadB